MAGWWLTYPSEKYSVGNIWQSQYMEKEKMFRITNQYITGNPSQISLALAAARSYPIHPAKPILSQKTRRLSFCMATSCSIYEPKSCRFFFGKHVGILFSPTHPPRHPTSCLTGRDAKVPGATALQRLGFQWPAKPPWRVLVTRALLGGKKRMPHIHPFPMFVCLDWNPPKQLLGSFDQWWSLCRHGKEDGGKNCKEYARAKEEQKHVPI